MFASGQPETALGTARLGGLCDIVFASGQPETALDTFPMRWDFGSWSHRVSESFKRVVLFFLNVLLWHNVQRERHVSSIKGSTEKTLLKFALLLFLRNI